MNRYTFRKLHRLPARQEGNCRTASLRDAGIQNALNMERVVIAIMIGMLTAWDLLNHLRATLSSEPHHKPRLMTALAMVLLLVLLVGLNLNRWQVYLDEIQDTYSDSIPAKLS